jgi:colanic acid biosynthesis glycosyl transferase WcaI
MHRINAASNIACCAPHSILRLTRRSARRTRGSSQTMHILVLTQYFHPEFGAAAIRLKRLTAHFVRAGHRVTVLTGMPNYPEGIIRAPYRGRLTLRERDESGVEVVRAWVFASPSKRARARLLNQASFLAASALRGLTLSQPDVLYVESHPLFATLSGGWLAARFRAPILLNVSDLWPESAVATGALHADSTIVKVAARVERWAYDRAAHIVAMTRGVYDGVLAVHPQPGRVSLIRNAADLDRFAPAAPEKRAQARAVLGLGEAFTAVHVGNMSLTYDFEPILHAAARLPDARFLFAGGGSQAEAVSAAVASRGLANVTLLGVLPHERMPDIWAAADLSLIALADHSVAGGTLPAKLYESLATGTPVVAAIRGEGAALVHESGGGLVTPIGDAEAYAAAVRTLMDNRDRLGEMARSGAAYARVAFSPEAVSEAYLARMESIRRKS